MLFAAQVLGQCESHQTLSRTELQERCTTVQPKFRWLELAEPGLCLQVALNWHLNRRTAVSMIREWHVSVQKQGVQGGLG